MDSQQKSVQRMVSWDFAGGPVVKNLPCSAGDVGSIPGWGTKMPHAAEKLSLRATTRESGLEIPHAIAKT